MQKPGLPVQQLVILSICRFAEPIVFTSILPYLPELIEYVGVPRPEVAKWAGIASAVASVSQAIMAVPWGTLSDHVGRKPIILSGLTCTMLLSILLGMSQTLPMVLVTRAFIGLMNGNVGIIRTMVAEIVPERELQPRAFSIMPLVWTVGSIFGPAFGGALARPAEKHPDWFGGSAFLRRFPFALPNLVAACFFVVGISSGFLFLRETLETKRDRYDYGLVLGQALTGSCTSRKSRSSEAKPSDEERTTLLPPAQKKKSKPAKRPSWSEVFTPQSKLILVAYTLMSGLGMAFDSVFPVFLHYPEQDFHNNPDVQLPFKFASGFGIGRSSRSLISVKPYIDISITIDAQTIGLFYTIIGIAGMIIQFLFFPVVAKRFGILNCFKAAAIAMPVIFFLTPFTTLVPGALRIPSVLLIMLLKLGTTVFGIPCCTILLTNSASSMNVLGTLNGVGTSVSALGRAAGPALIGAAFSYGVKQGYVVIPWWLLSALALWSVVPAFWIVEQDGPSRDEAQEEEVEESESHRTGYGAIDTRSDAGRK
ncbi:permease of the major facilitator superfamily [Penicillium hispanicum]|uniref:permease of the major facilitator superfamily n=1 Tax=Penicillium hispanicum TaxID=1080232 RepID=UPI0025408AF6|nr:permease of the major facilitator superfamily [Penicillium hispanicum]KAJ5586928.1 permease of the major facilitator superfamily [Penicillium hispanicum]